MHELFKAIKKITFESFCSWIKQNENGTIDFKLKPDLHGNKITEVFRIQKLDENLIISDMGNTLANLKANKTENSNEVKELSDRERFYINKILWRFNIKSAYDSFFHKIDTSEDILPQIMYFLRRINFIYTMKLFNE